MTKGNIKDLKGLEKDDNIDNIEDLTDNKFKRFIKELIPYVIILVVVVLFRTFIATPVLVHGSSMNPTLNNNDFMILNKLADIDRFDIVVVSIPEEDIIKRVIALPGETISIENGVVYVNDKRQDEEYSQGITTDYPRTTLADDEYFVMGDNREHSTDSRRLGPVKKDQIKGTTKLVLFPFKDIGFVK